MSHLNTFTNQPVIRKNKHMYLTENWFLFIQRIEMLKNGKIQIDLKLGFLKQSKMYNQ